MSVHDGDWLMTIERAAKDAAKEGGTLDRLMLRRLLHDVERAGWSAGYIAGSTDAWATMQEKRGREEQP